MDDFWYKEPVCIEGTRLSVLMNSVLVLLRPSVEVVSVIQYSAPTRRWFCKFSKQIRICHFRKQFVPSFVSCCGSFSSKRKVRQKSTFFFCQNNVWFMRQLKIQNVLISRWFCKKANYFLPFSEIIRWICFEFCVIMLWKFFV